MQWSHYCHIISSASMLTLGGQQQLTKLTDRLFPCSNRIKKNYIKLETFLAIFHLYNIWIEHIKLMCSWMHLCAHGFINDIFVLNLPVQSLPQNPYEWLNENEISLLVQIEFLVILPRGFFFFLPFSGKEYNLQNLKDIEVTAEITDLNPQTNC